MFKLDIRKPIEQLKRKILLQTLILFFVLSGLAWGLLAFLQYGMR